MAEDLDLDPTLLARARELSGEATNEGAVTQALLEFVAIRNQRAWRDLFQKLDWDVGYDYKRERSRSN